MATMDFSNFYDDGNNHLEHPPNQYSYFQDNNRTIQHSHGLDHLQDHGNMQSSQLFRDNGNSMHRGVPLHQFQDFDSQQFTSGPSMTSDQMSATHPQSHSIASSHMLIAHHQVPPHHRKKHEELDSACRPRLTAEQTLILEDYFAHTPRPTTQQKRQHAVNLGLTQEKVNNWFQNRRAKSKQQNRTRRDFELLEGGNPQQSLQQWDETQDDQSSGLPTSPLGAESGSMSSMDHTPKLHADSKAIDTKFWEDSHDHINIPFDGSSTAYAQQDVQHLLHGHQHHLPQDTDFIAQNLANDNFPDGTSWFLSNDSETKMFSHPDEIAADGSDVILHQSPNLTPAQFHFVHHTPSNSSLSTGDDQNTVFSQSTVSLVQNPTVSYHVSPVESPRLSPFVAASNHEAFSRRGSASSELANNFNTIHLQRAPSQQTSDEEVFKTPVIPVSNLAARRKKQRPAALIPMRTVSASLPPILSPSNKDVSSAQSVRRIKSTGNSLNVIGSRVQKSSMSSTQRSPFNIASFNEAAALERLHNTAVPVPDRHDSMFSVPSQNCEAESSLMPDNLNLPIQHPQSPADYVNHWHQSTSPSESLAAPPLSACFTQKSHDDGSHAASPPVTPYTLQPGYMNQWPHNTVPQSAPAHILSFPDFSSPVGTQPTTPSFFAPQPQCPGPQFLNPGQNMQQQPMFSHASVPSLYDLDHQPRISRSYSSGGQFNFFPAPPQPQKELEVVMTTFPPPAGGAAAQPKIKLPQNFTFQNSGPKDYAAES